MAESEKRVGASAAEAERLRAALAEAEQATAAAADAQRGAEARASAAEQATRDRVANLMAGPMLAVFCMMLRSACKVLCVVFTSSGVATPMCFYTMLLAGPQSATGASACEGGSCTVTRARGKMKQLGCSAQPKGVSPVQLSAAGLGTPQAQLGQKQQEKEQAGARLGHMRQEVELLRQQYRAAQQSYERQARPVLTPLTRLQRRGLRCS